MALRDGVILGAPVPRRIKSGALILGAPDLILLGSLDSSRRPSVGIRPPGSIKSFRDPGIKRKPRHRNVVL